MTHERTLLAGAGLAVCLLVGACDEAVPPVSAAARAVGAPEPGDYTTFESGQVRPLAMSANGQYLYVANTPDSRLEVFRISNAGLVPVSSVVVGLEPVAVAARGNDEVWVVNHLSDSVSVVDVGNKQRPRVTRTLLVGDEPRDVVFAGPNRRRAFITTAHRGQNSPIDPQLRTPGVGRADVWVFDAQNLGASLGGTPLTIVTLFSDTPRALAVTPDGTRVYAAGFHTGNQTTSVGELFVPNGGEAAGGLPLPNFNIDGDPQAETALIVKYRDGHWLDNIGRVWDAFVMYTLPDKDVFVLDAMANPPAQLAGAAGVFSHVGTVLFNMIVNPVNGKVYVANTDAQNDVRFEGPGIFAGTSVRGHLAESRITVLAGGQVLPRHLNKHIDYSVCCAATPSEENVRSLAFPMDMAISANGATLYVAAFGSSKIGIYDTQQLENDTFVPSTVEPHHGHRRRPLRARLDEGRGRLYVMTRFDNSVSVVDTGSRQEVAHLALHNPEPDSVVRGRPLLYDAARTSSHGDSACASCHIFGDFDSLAWDLGNPDAPSSPNLNPIIALQGAFAFPPIPTSAR
jgi:YVTN family beta-propeller protein